MKKSKPVDRAVELTAAELLPKVRELRLICEVFDDFLEAVEQSPTKSLAVHNYKSLERGLDGLNSAASAMRRAIMRFQAGNSLEPGELKPRSPEHARKRVAEPKKPYKK